MGIIAVFTIGNTFTEDVPILDTKDSFKVRWYDFKPGLTKHSVKVEIQNINKSHIKNFNFRLLFSDTNYPIEKTTATVYIKEAVPTKVPTYDVRLIKKKCQMFDNKTMKEVTYDCSYNETYQNGTVIKRLVNLVPTEINFVEDKREVKKKFGIFAEVNGIMGDYKLIDVPEFGSEKKLDDVGEVENMNGTMSFMIEWTTPIIKSKEGFGSSGSISIEDSVTGNVYT